MNKPSWEFTVKYGNDEWPHASISGGEETARAAFKAVEGYVVYYANLGYIIKYIKVYLACANCSGSGNLPRPKRGPNKAPWMPLPECPKCKGTGVGVLVHEEGEA